VKFKVIFLLLILSFFFTACSKLDVAVRVADRFAIKAISRHFDLNSEEEKEIRNEFQKIFNEVKKEELLELVNVLEDFAGQVRVEAVEGSARVQIFINSSSQIFMRALQRFQPLGEKLIEIQATKDFKEFDKMFLENIKKSEAKLKVEQEQKSNEFKRMDRWVKESIGALTTEQKKSFIPALKKIIPVPDLYIKSRKKVHEDFSLVRKDPKLRKDFVESYFKNWLTLQTLEYQKARKNFESSFEIWIAQLYSDLNSKQKRLLEKNLRIRAEQLRKVAERARTS